MSDIGISLEELLDMDQDAVLAATVMGKLVERVKARAQLRDRNAGIPVLEIVEEIIYDELDEYKSVYLELFGEEYADDDGVVPTAVYLVGASQQIEDMAAEICNEYFHKEELREAIAQ